MLGFSDAPARQSAVLGGAVLKEFFGDLRGRALWVVLGALVCQMGLGYGYVFGALQDPVRLDLGWTRTEYSTAVAARLPINALALSAVGFLTLRIGARGVLTGACFLGAATFLALGRMNSLWQLYALIPFVGIILGSFGDVAVGHVVTRWVQRGRGTALGLVYVGSNLAGMTLVPLVAWIARRASWRLAFSWVGVGLAAFILPWAAFAVRDPRPGEGAPDAEESEAGAANDLNLARALWTRSFWLLGFNLFATFFYLVSMIDQIVSILADAGMPHSDAAATFGTIVGMGLFGKLAMGPIADRIPAPRAMQLNTALLAFSSLLLFQLPAPGPLWLFVASFGFAYTARDVLYPVIVVHCFGVRYLAEIYGVLMLTLLAGMLGSIAAAASRDYWGSYDAAFALYAALNLLSLLAVWFLRDERRRGA